MRVTSIIAIYALFWVLSAFCVMPFGIRTHDEAGIDKIPGQADSAPANFQPFGTSSVYAVIWYCGSAISALRVPDQ